MIDFLALTGDAVDNVPGVSGIGPKRAAKIVAEAGCSLREVISDPSRISEGSRRIIQENAQRLLINLEVLALNREIECGLSLEDLAVRPQDPARLLPFFERMEFHSMAQSLREIELF